MQRVEHGIIKTILKELVKEDFGYIIRSEEWQHNGVPEDPKIIIKSGYTLDGNYIGNLDITKFICEKKGIKPELRTPNSNTCSIGFSEKDQKWYGWSHRAICGFKIGDVVKEGDCAASPGTTKEYLKEHPEEDFSLPVGFTAKTLEDCKKMAIAFADSVS